MANTSSEHGWIGWAIGGVTLVIGWVTGGVSSHVRLSGRVKALEDKEAKNHQEMMDFVRDIDKRNTEYVSAVERRLMAHVDAAERRHTDERKEFREDFKYVRERLDKLGKEEGRAT